VENVKVGLSLTFAEALKPWLDLRSLVRIGDPAAEVQGEPMIFASNERRRRIILQVRAFSTEQEVHQSVKALADGVSDAIKEFASTVEVPKVEAMRLDAIYIDPYELPFHELVDRQRSVFFSHHELVLTASDVMFALDWKVDDNRTDHLQLGPMVPDQLNAQFLVFKRDDLPAQFAFAGISRTFQNIRDWSADYAVGQLGEFKPAADERAASVFGAIRD
jgi:hypothetical protein